MSKFNTGRGFTMAPGHVLTSPVTSVPVDIPVSTYEGGIGAARDVKSELFLLAVTNMVGTGTFYESANMRDGRFRDLVRQATREDPSWVARFVPFLRDEMFMRSASIVMAAESAMVRLQEKIEPVYPTVRELVASACSRADEPAEFLAYWRANWPRNSVPGGVQRGLGDAVTRLYNEYTALKYGYGNLQMGDVIELVRPTPSAPWQDDLFKYILDRRHHSSEIRVSLERLPKIRAWREMQAMTPEQRVGLMSNPAALRRHLDAAQMTWEDFSGWLVGTGVSMGAAQWEFILPQMPYMALLRNLRNFEQAGVALPAMKSVLRRIVDPAAIVKSKQFPFRFLSAYNAVSSLGVQAALEEALDASLANVPVLNGSSLVLVDCSSSMFPGMSHPDKATGLHRYELAALFGTALWKRAIEAGQRVDLVAFGGDYGAKTQVMTFPRGQSLLPAIRQFGDMGGTATTGAVRKHYANHDRVIILTDEQARDGDPGSVIPATVPLYTVNLAGYQFGHGPSGSARRHTFGGLNDKMFKVIELLETGASAVWPF